MITHTIRKGSHGEREWFVDEYGKYLTVKEMAGKKECVVSESGLHTRLAQNASTFTSPYDAMTREFGMSRGQCRTLEKPVCHETTRWSDLHNIMSVGSLRHKALAMQSR